jgi:hypothetical protein
MVGLIAILGFPSLRPENARTQNELTDRDNDLEDTTIDSKDGSLCQPSLFYLNNILF